MRRSDGDAAAVVAMGGLSSVYLTLRDRPGDSGTSANARPARRGVGRVVVTLGLVSLLTDISSESVAAILPLYLTAVVGLSPVAYGVVDGLYQGVSALLRAVAGWTSDRTGRPKWVALLGYGLSMLARLALVFATGVGAITALLSTDRVGKGLRTAPRDAMIAASAPTERLGLAFGVHRTLDTVGAALGPLIAFLILVVIPDGFTTVLVVSAGFSVLGVTVLGLFVPGDTGRRPRTPKESSSDNIASARLAGSEDRVRLRDVGGTRLRRLLVVAGALGLATVGDGFLYLALLDSGGFAAHWFPLLYVGTNVAFLALAVPLGKLADTWGRATMLGLGHAALATAYLVAALAGGGVAVTLAVLALLGAFYAATDGLLAAVAGELVPVRARASGIGTAQSVVALARMASSIAFGVLWVVLGPEDGLLLLGLVLVAAVPLALRVLRPLDRTVTAS